MGSVLVPVHLGGNHAEHPDIPGSPQAHERGRDVMDDLVDQLAALDSKSNVGHS